MQAHPFLMRPGRPYKHPCLAGYSGGLLLLVLLALLIGLTPMQSVQAAVTAGWSPLTGASGTGTSGVVNALGLDSNNNLYVGGNFVTAGGVTVNSIALWDGTDWSGFTGPSATGLASGGNVNGLALDSAGQLFITGNFTTVGGLPGAFRGGGAKWNGAAWVWLDPTAPYNIISAIGNALVIDGSDRIYFGGDFVQAGNSMITANGVTRFDDATTTFFNLQDSVTSGIGVSPINVRALALDSSNNLYVGGGFTLAGGVANTARIAMYNGMNWLPLGAGIDNGQVNALAFDSLGNLYAGGTFNSVNGGTAAAGIAMWNGTAWTALGSGVTGGSVNALAITPDNVVYVGGSFTSAGGVAGTSRLARWSGGWRALPEGVPDNSVNALKYDSLNNALYVGGSFVQAGTPAVTVNRVAIYQPGNVVVNTADDVVDANGGNCAGLAISQLPGPDGFTSLREAICAANVAPGLDTITFDNSLDSIPITLSIPGTDEDANATGDLDITGDLTITGNGATNTIIQAGTNDTNGIDRVFHVVSNVNVTFENLTIRYGQTTASGGGIYNTSGSTAVLDSEINGNRAAFGGGIANIEGTITLNQSTVSGNTATANGGGIDSDAFGFLATLNIYNSTFSGNSAGNAGGAILAYTGGAANSVVNLVNTTVHNNNAFAGALASWDNGGGAAIINMQNSVVALQAAATANCTAITGGVFNSNNHNLESANTCNLTQLNDIPNGTANLGPLQDNGGATKTHALLNGSQAIDAGNNMVCAAAPLNSRDQRGVLRPQGATCDIGAYELVTAVTPGTSGGDGPGGVGTTDGGSTLRLWLRADRDVYSDAGCTTPGSDGNTAGCWKDQSGNNFNFTNTVVATHPVYEMTETGINNQPSLQFTNDRLVYLNFPVLTNINDYVIYGVSQHNADAGTLIGGVQTGGNGHGLQIASWAAGNNVRFLHRMPFSSGGGNDLIMTNNAYTAGTPHMVTAVRNKTNNVHAARVDGGVQQSIVATAAVFSSNLDIAVGNRSGGANPGHVLNGYIGEVIIFAEAPMDVRRLLVENYLSSKYTIAIPGANDFYDGDTPGNGDFDLDVAGIGRFGGNSHTQAHAAGMIVVNRTFLQDNGDWLLFGHRTPSNANTASDLPTTGEWATAPNPQRWERHFYVDVTDSGVNGGTVDIIFDFSEGRMNNCCLPSGPISNYRLLKRDNLTGPFTDMATATAIIGDQVHFQGIDVSLLGSNFTLGTLDALNSPTAVSLQSITATSQPDSKVILLLSVVLLTFTLLGVHIYRPDEVQNEA